MVGTEKQIAYAKACIEGAKAWFSSRHEKTGRQIDSDGVQLAAIDVIEAVERGDYEAAEEIFQDAAGWVEFTIVERDGKPQIDAGRVIEHLKYAYYRAKERGLVG